MILSQDIANLRSKQISTLAIAQKMYGYSTELGHRKIVEQANQHPNCCSGYGIELESYKSAGQTPKLSHERYINMILSKE